MKCCIRSNYGGVVVTTDTGPNKRWPALHHKSNGVST